MPGLKAIADTLEGDEQSRAVSMHAARPQFVSTFEKKLVSLKDTYALAKWLRELGREEIPDPDVLLPEIEAVITEAPSEFSFR